MTSGWLTERYLRLPDGTFPHLGIRSDGDVASVALLCGSPERVELIVGMLQGAERVGSRRGYAVYTGSYGGTAVSVAMSGLGSPSLAVAVEELAACGGRTFLRVGSCASIDPQLSVGAVAVAYGAVRDEGTSVYYAPPIYPAVSAPHVVSALLEAAREVGVDVAVGLTRSTDSFYEGERKAEIIERWSALGVRTFEMETSALFTMATARGLEAGSILCVGSNLITGEATYRGERIGDYERGQESMLRIALLAAAALGKG